MSLSSVRKKHLAAKNLTEESFREICEDSMTMAEACRRAKIKGLRWHDLRRHAISVMFEVKGLDVPTVQLISGHKNPMVLLNTYTKLNPEKLVAKLG